jgi:hypothetical protein
MSTRESTNVRRAVRLIATLALSAVADAALLMLVGSCSVCLAQQAASVSSDETLAEKVNDPTANLTQITIQDLYALAEYGTNAQPNTLQIRPVLAVRPQLFTPLEQLIRPTFNVLTVPRGKGASTTTALRDADHTRNRPERMMPQPQRNDLLLTASDFLARLPAVRVATAMGAFTRLVCQLRSCVFSLIRLSNCQSRQLIRQLIGMVTSCTRLMQGRRLRGYWLNLALRWSASESCVLLSRRC